MTTSSVREDRFHSRVPPVGTVLRWRHQGITHLALHVGVVPGSSRSSDTWRVTAGHPEREVTWEHVRSLIGNNPCSIAVGWGEVALMVEADFGDVAVVDYVEQLRRNRLGVIDRNPS